MADALQQATTATPMRALNAQAATPGPAAAGAAASRPPNTSDLATGVKSALGIYGREAPVSTVTGQQLQRASAAYDTSARDQEAYDTLLDAVAKLVDPAQAWMTTTVPDAVCMSHILDAVSNADPRLVSPDEAHRLAKQWLAKAATPAAADGISQLAKEVASGNEHVRNPEKPYIARLREQLADVTVDTKELEGFLARAAEEGTIDQDQFGLLAILIDSKVADETKSKYLATFIMSGFEHRWDLHRAAMARSAQDLRNCFKFSRVPGPILPETHQHADLNRFARSIINYAEAAIQTSVPEVEGGSAHHSTKPPPFSKAKRAKINKIEQMAAGPRDPTCDESFNKLVNTLHEVTGGAEFGKPVVKEPMSWKVSLYDAHNQQQLEMDLTPLAEYLINLRGKVDAHGRALEHLKQAFAKATRVDVQSRNQPRNPRGGGAPDNDRSSKELKTLKADLGRLKALCKANGLDF